MKTARELFPEFEKWRTADYQPILDDIAPILTQISLGSYQGDDLVVFDDAGRYGYLRLGWGSCSGCDSLRACYTYDDLEREIASVRASVQWFDSREEAIRFFREHDWDGEYFRDEPGLRSFVTGVIETLEGRR